MSDSSVKWLQQCHWQWQHSWAIDKQYQTSRAKVVPFKLIFPCISSWWKPITKAYFRWKDVREDTIVKAARLVSLSLKPRNGNRSSDVRLFLILLTEGQEDHHISNIARKSYHTAKNNQWERNFQCYKSLNWRYMRISFKYIIEIYYETM